MKIRRNKTERKNERRTNEIKMGKMGRKKTEKKKGTLVQEEEQERA